MFFQFEAFFLTLPCFGHFVGCLKPEEANPSQKHAFVKHALLLYIYIFSLYH